MSLTTKWPQPRPLQLALALLLLLIGLAASLAIHQRSLHEQLFYSLKSLWHQAERQAHSIWLPDYRVNIQALPIAGIKNNLSGLAWDEHRHQLWAVVNNKEALLTLDAQGQLTNHYPLKGFADVEAIAYLGDDLLMLVEERAQALVIVPVPRHAGPLYREDYQAITLGLSQGGTANMGFEGIGYDSQGDRLFVVKEHSPRKLYEIRGIKTSLNGQLNLHIIDRHEWIDDKQMARDLSSVEVDPNTGHLLLLSDESEMLIELDRRGQLVSYLSLLDSLPGLKKDIAHPEGVALDQAGNLYLVSEPNLFYRFSRQTAPLNSSSYQINKDVFQ